MEGTTSFDCPINMTPMVDPVMAADGHSYERTAIENHFRHNPRDTRSPMTNMVLDNKKLTPNHTLKKCMQDAKETAALAHQTAMHQKRGASAEVAGDAKRAKTPDDTTAVFAAELKCMVYAADVAGVLTSFRRVLCSSLVMENRALHSLCRAERSASSILPSLMYASVARASRSWRAGSLPPRSGGRGGARRSASVARMFAAWTVCSFLGTGN